MFFNSHFAYPILCLSELNLTFSHFQCKSLNFWLANSNWNQCVCLRLCQFCILNRGFQMMFWLSGNSSNCHQRTLCYSCQYKNFPHTRLVLKAPPRLGLFGRKYILELAAVSAGEMLFLGSYLNGDIGCKWDCVADVEWTAEMTRVKRYWIVLWPLA